jgi:hypothetical protein
MLAAINLNQGVIEGITCTCSKDKKLHDCEALEIGMYISW